MLPLRPLHQRIAQTVLPKSQVSIKYFYYGLYLQVFVVRVMRPSLLVLLKLGAWHFSVTSSQPAVQARSEAYLMDMKAGLRWLSDRNE